MVSAEQLDVLRASMSGPVGGSTAAGALIPAGYVTTHVAPQPHPRRHTTFTAHSSESPVSTSTNHGSDTASTPSSQGAPIASAAAPREPILAAAAASVAATGNGTHSASNGLTSSLAPTAVMEANGGSSGSSSEPRLLDIAQATSQPPQTTSSPPPTASVQASPAETLYGPSSGTGNGSSNGGGSSMPGPASSLGTNSVTHAPGLTAHQLRMVGSSRKEELVANLDLWSATGFPTGLSTCIIACCKGGLLWSMLEGDLSLRSCCRRSYFAVGLPPNSISTHVWFGHR